MTTPELMRIVHDELADLRSDAERIAFLKRALHRVLENHADLARKLEDAKDIEGYAGYAADQAEDAIRMARPRADERAANTFAR